MSYAELINRAHDAATAAILARFQAGNREMPFNCGFAWVTISGTSSFAKWCRAQPDHRRFGAKGYPRGWQFWCPGQWPYGKEMGHAVYQQDMDFYLAAAKAFAAVLRENGIEAVVDSRLD